MNKNILITAGSKNLGFCTAEHFASRGYDVHITSRDLKKSEEAAKKLMDKYPNIRAYAYSLELGDTKAIERVFSEIKTNCEHLDVFVANAAQLGIGYDIFNCDEEKYDEVMNTNVKGTLFCCKEAGKLMKDNGGSIILIGSVQSKGAVEGRMLYGMSKGAIDVMTKYLAYDFAPYKIRVNCLIAGAIHTDRWNVDDETLAKRRIDYLTGKESDMPDIVNGIVFLAEDTSKSMTGTELIIDSGRLTGLLPYRDKKLLKREGY